MVGRPPRTVTRFFATAAICRVPLFPPPCLFCTCSDQLRLTRVQNKQEPEHIVGSSSTKDPPPASIIVRIGRLIFDGRFFRAAVSGGCGTRLPPARAGWHRRPFVFYDRTYKCCHMREGVGCSESTPSSTCLYLCSPRGCHPVRRGRTYTIAQRQRTFGQLVLRDDWGKFKGSRGDDGALTESQLFRRDGGALCDHSPINRAPGRVSWTATRFLQDAPAGL